MSSTITYFIYSNMQSIKIPSKYLEQYSKLSIVKLCVEINPSGHLFGLGFKNIDGLHTMVYDDKIVENLLICEHVDYSMIGKVSIAKDIIIPYIHVKGEDIILEPLVYVDGEIAAFDNIILQLCFSTSPW